jgi:glycosyltransferase involved in cell wall biosynthesis
MHRYESQFPEVSSRGLYQVRERHFRRMCRYASGVLVDSEVGKQHVRESYSLSTDQIHVLPFVPPRHIRLSGPEAPGQALPSKFVFYPAQFWMHKNHQRLIQAAARVRQNCPDFHLVLAGSKKNAYAATVAAVKALGLSDNVHFLGYVPDAQMALLYRKARALIMPTFFGPTNIPPLEAIASGCPVAVSKIYGMPQQLGDAALYFDPTCVAEMASAMEALWTDDGLCRRLISRGLRRAAEWTQEHFNARFGEILKTVLRMNPCGKR